MILETIDSLILESNELDILNAIKIKNKELTLYSGFGYCGYGSKLLSNELNKNNIQNSILLGTYFTESVDGIKCKNRVNSLILTFPENGIYGIIKAGFIKRGNSLPDRTGHSVVLINDIIYDITSDQFGLPSMYSLKLFKLIWKSVKIIDIKIDKTNDFYISNKIKTIKILK